ncbi:glycoside hydrolase family 78 protein [Microbacterium excoecariae]|uniref:glycoside hydrolase family 78 protein n=1 Tax=Microbacterium excoecariae TaxID=2715210 RepID=UPI00140A22B6|nr:glycoside hydrolase family 78 protein [Microbacterium excoecariae]NHI15741.1 family 78 glycoside hydrolase catalytic domain [Microbacterium excoecariae]
MTLLPSAPRFAHHDEALGIGESTPRLSWQTTAPPGWRQAGYDIEVRRGATSTVHAVASADQVLVPWPADPLGSRERADVRVRVTGHGGATSAWGPWASVEAGLLEAGDWSAAAIGAAWPEASDKDLRRPPLLRRAFVAPGDVSRARLYVTAHGLYEVEINGTRVGSDALNPGWTVYSERLQYHTYDVTNLLVEGDNVIGAWLGDGWYRGRLGFSHHGHTFDLYGEDLSLIAQLEITREDASVITVATDAAWRAAPAPILASGLYDGEDYDARAERAGWSTAGFDEAGWEPVAVRPARPERFVAPDGPPVRCTEEIAPTAVLTSPSGRRILDFGQNFAGRVRITVSGAAGSTVTLRTAEVLQDGEIYTRPLRAAKSTDRYTLRGDASETWEPRFTIHGFRYVEVDGWPGSLDDAVARGEIVGRVYHSDMRRTGWFACSDPDLERLHENVVWGTRSNFVDIPTDCPQRDERLGWTGDIQVFAPTASFLFDVSGFLTSWLKDLAVEQRREGTVPWFVPVIPGGPMWTPTRPGAVWGDAAVLTPWTLFERFSDTGVLAAQYDSARTWVDQILELAGENRLWDTGFQLGDWLDPAAPPDDPADARTDRYLVASAYLAWSTRRLADAAEALGRGDDAAHYRDLAREVRAAFVEAYWDPAARRLTSDAQTAYALAIHFELLGGDDREAAGARLAELVAEGGNRIAVGFAGVNVVADALSATGHDDAAFALLLERSCPSWLYMVDQGATTVWERWDSLLPDGTVNPGRMTSFNHYALGSIADWMHRVIAGLAPAEPGYRRIRIAPAPGPLASASARHETPYGPARVDWRIADGRFSLTAEIPSGTTADVVLPSGARHEVASGTHSFSEDV